MKTYHSILCLISLMLCSCGIGSYTNPKGDPSTLAQIVSTQEGNDFFPKAQYIVAAIGQQEVYYGRSWTIKGKKILVRPGKQKFMAQVYSMKSMSPFTGVGNVEFLAEAGKQYRLTGSIDGAEAYVWVENALTRKKVSQTNRILLQYIPPSYTPMILPVYQ